MNRTIWWLCALAGSLAWGQANPGTAPSPAAAQDEDKDLSPAAAVAMDAPVLTIKGFCHDRKTADQKAASAVVDSACQTVITRAQFEKMTSAIRPNMTMSAKQQLANLYPRLLVMSQRAEEIGLDKQAPFDEMIAFSRMQILTQGLTRKVQEESAKVSDHDIAEYYGKHPEEFEQYTLQRLLVPLRKQPAGAKATDNQTSDSKAAAEEKSSEQELAELAQSLRARAAAGEDFLKLQREAFDAAGVKVASPTTALGKVRRSALPASHTAIFELKVGEVSQVITDSGGHYIYKLEAKDRLSLDQAKDEIRQTVQNQHAKDALDKIQASYTTETNKAYFTLPPSQPDK